MAVLLDIVDGDTYNVSYKGFELIRIATVTELVGGPHEKLVNAASLLPLLGTSHPRIAGAILQNINGNALSTNSATFRLTYSQEFFGPTGSSNPPGEEVIEVGSTVSTISTNKDVLGEIVTVKYQFPTDYKYNDDFKSTEAVPVIDTASADMQVMIPNSELHISRRMRESPEDDAIDYVGFVNSNFWHRGEPRTWLCTSITGTSSDGGVTYLARYSFQYRFDKWDGEVRYIDPNTGRSPPDLVQDVGIKTPNNYNEADFGRLFN